MYRLRYPPQHIHTLHHGLVKVLDLDVRHDLRLQRLQLLPLGISDAKPGLLSLGERLQLAIELAEQAPRIGIFADALLGLLVARDRRMLRQNLAEILGPLENVL